MRVLLTTRGSAGHVLPLAPLAHACIEAGHEVLVAAQSQHRANVERARLPFAPVSDPPRDEWMPLMGSLAELDLDMANALMIGEFFGNIDTRAALPGLLRIVETWQPDVVVRESWEFASTIAADLLGIPLARVGLGLASVEEFSVEVAAAPVDAARVRAGLPPDPSGERLTAAPYLTQMPELVEAAAAPGPIVRRLRTTPPRAIAPLPDWWPGNEDPLVYVTFGSVTADAHLPYFPALYRAALDALASLPARVLVTIGNGNDPGRLGPVTRNCYVERWIPRARSFLTRRRSSVTAATAQRWVHSRTACRSWSCRCSASTSGLTPTPSPAWARGSPSPASGGPAVCSTCRVPPCSRRSRRRSPACSRIPGIDARQRSWPTPSARCRRSTPRWASCAGC